MKRDDNTRVAVASRSFSANELLRRELTDRYAKVTFNAAGRSLQGDELVSFLRGHEKAIIALERVDEPLLAQLPDLRVIAKYGVGLNNLDLLAMTRRGVRLGWSPGVNAQSVAELTIALMIITLRQLQLANDEVRSGKWRQVAGGDLNGRVVGVVGLGHVGKRVAALLRAFGCTVLSNDIVPMHDYCAKRDIREVSLDDLLDWADIVTLHLPFDASTRRMFDADRLGRMKPGAVLINTARGGIVDEAALLSMLDSGRLSAAGVDVLEMEPPQDDRLVKHPRTFATPHIGGSSREAVLAMGRAAIEGLDSAVDAASFVA